MDGVEAGLSPGICGGGVTLFLDNAVAINQGVRGRASVGLWVQQWVHPISRLEAFCGGCKARAFEATRGIQRQLGDNMCHALYIGSMAQYVGEALGPVVPLPGELEGGGDGDVGLFGSSWVSGRVEREGGFIRLVGSKGDWVWMPE